MKTKIFISYSIDDKRKLNSLSAALKKSSKHFRPIVIDRRAHPGKPLSDKVKEGIQETPFFISVLTRSSFRTQWVNQELGYAVANDRNIYPLIERSILKNLKGFVHNQIDLPFIFDGNQANARKEAQSFVKCCNELVRHLEQIKFAASISPNKVKQGESYTTTVNFCGQTKNAFFTNYVKHVDSTWSFWHWDPSTLKDHRASSPGELHGSIRVKSSFSYSTKEWPIGKYKIHTRVYEHPMPGELRRFILFEKINDFEVS